MDGKALRRSHSRFLETAVISTFSYWHLRKAASDEHEIINNDIIPSL